MAKRFEKSQINALNLAFEESENLTKEKKIDLVTVTGLDMEQIASWFNRKRVCKRARESIGDLERSNAELQQALRGCQERETKLKKQLEESRVRKAELEAENRLLEQRLRTLEGDIQFDYVMGFENGYHKE